ncbi:tetratricopeptide repeat protein 7B-like isoform X2 [Acropora palmata]|uniref:tetratricopeptide repeat protein 7B-like isoform X2 n=1 Tax=Acropora palmata TaxID=6131 RepID=UPI003DA18A3B
MARRSKTSLENDIERSRWEEKWENIPKLVEQLSSRTTTESSIDALKNLLMNESRLEIYLRNNPLGTTCAAEAKVQLKEVVSNLTKLVSQDKLQKSDKTQEALFLLCKAHFVMEDFHSCVKYCNQGGADDIFIESQSKRKSKLVADGFAHKAMALEQLQSMGELSVSDDDIIACYECAGDIVLWLTTDHISTTRTTGSSQIMSLGQTLEVAIQRAPVLLIKNGKMTQGINRFRHLLRVIESKATMNLRKGLAKQLAQVLLRGICEQSYERPLHILHNSPMISSTTSVRSVSKATGETKASINIIACKHASFPLKPQMYTGDSLFFPQNETEEILILLLLEEAMVLKDAELSQGPEKAALRRKTVADSESVYDLLTVALVRRAQYGVLAECLDRGMKVAFEEFHLWFQFALALISAGKHHRALLVLRQCHQLRPEDSSVCLYAAKLCFNNLHMIDEGIAFAKKVVALGDEKELSSRGYLALGIGYSLKAGEACLRGERQQFQKRAIEALQRAHNLDPDDSEVLFHLSLCQAHMRQITKALKNVRNAVKMDMNQSFFLHLLALVLSSQKKFVEALEVCDAALMEFPEDFSLLVTKVKLEQTCVGGDQALITCKKLLQTWKLVYDSDLSRPSVELQRAGSGLLDKVITDTRSLKQIPLTEIGSDKDSMDGASSIAASVRLEQALSDEAASASIKLSVPAVLALQAKLWLSIAEVFISMEKDAEANACVQEAHLIFPLSPDVFFQGSLYHKTGNLVMAEKVLREAINIDPTAFEAWHLLGVVLEAQNEHEAASECLMTAIDLEATRPILPFTIIPRFL